VVTVRNHGHGARVGVAGAVAGVVPDRVWGLAEPCEAK
jgi:hypothetical protein